jgi:hypothetical protein
MAKGGSVTCNPILQIRILPDSRKRFIQVYSECIQAEEDQEMLQIIGQSLLIAARMDRAAPPPAERVRPVAAPHGFLRDVAAQIAASRRAWRSR